MTRLRLRLVHPVAAVAAVAMLPFALSAPPAIAAPPQQRVNLGMSLTSDYDSNILEYSNDQIALFESGTRPDRFSLQSTDDLVWNPMVALGWEAIGARGRRHLLRLRAEGDFHQKNGTADFRAASASWRESWSRDRRLTIGWYTLPQFYLRQLLAEDYVPPFPGLSRERRAQFSLDIASADWSQRIGRSNALGLDGQYERRVYNGDFRERSSNTYQGEGAWGWTRLPHQSRLELRGLYRLSDAKGTDGDEVAGLVPDDADVGYHGIGVGAHGEIEVAHRKGWRVTGDSDYEYSTRDFDSDRPADRYHFGRKDRLHELQLGLALRWRRDWRARAFWQLDRNTAHLGASAPATTDAGDYTRSQVGVRLDWSRTVWSTLRDVPEDDQ